jgi:hypothetical protein
MKFKSSSLFQDVLPIYKYPKVIKGPNIDGSGPYEGHFHPEKYFECPVLDHKVEKIDVSFGWKDQVTYRKISNHFHLLR